MAKAKIARRDKDTCKDVCENCQCKIKHIQEMKKGKKKMKKECQCNQ